MRVFVSALLHETNASSPIPTNLASFESVAWHRPTDCVPDDRSRELVGYGALVRAAEAAGCDVVASRFCYANPSRPCALADYQKIRDEILADLREKGPFDLVLLFLHGAQMADGIDDCEGDILRRARAIVGPDTVIGVELDLHANVTTAMIESASIICSCKEYPHTDLDQTANFLFEASRRLVVSGARAHMEFVPVPMLGLFHTTDPELAGLVADIRVMEGRDGVIAISLLHGFAWSNTPLAQAGVLIVHEEGREPPSGLVEDISHRFFAIRDESERARIKLDEAMARVADVMPHVGRPMVIADISDNAGAGAASDSTFILRALLQQGSKDVFVGLLWDPVAAGLARDAGVGNSFTLRVGGKSGPLGGPPLDVEATVLAVRDDLVQDTVGLKLDLGLTVLLDIAGVLVGVNSVRQQLTSPSCLVDLGIEISRLRAIFVKSAQHFRALFEPFASEILYCNGPGPLNMVSAAAAGTLHGLPRPIWPLDRDILR